MFALPDVDLSGAVLGTTGVIKLQNMGISAGGISANPSTVAHNATIYFHNDSGCGLLLIFKDSAQSANLPAGAWVPIPIMPGESQVMYVVNYALPTPPVSKLLMTYYAPGEEIPAHTLGNSPVGIGGTVTTSSVQTLSNEGNAAGTLVIDVGDAALSQLIKFYTDHFLISVDQSGVRHQVLAGNTSGNPLQIGQAGDTAEVLGALTVDQVLTATNAANAVLASTLGGLLSALDDTVNALNRLVTASNRGFAVRVNDGAANHDITIFDKFGNVQMIVPGTNIGGNLAIIGSSSLDNGKITTDGAGNLGVQGGNVAAGSFTHLNPGSYLGRDSANSSHTLLALLQADNDAHIYTTSGHGLLKVTNSAKTADIAEFSDSNFFQLLGSTVLKFHDNSTVYEIHGFTGTGSGTFNHNCSKAPNAIMLTTSVAGSQTMGYDSVTATTVHVTAGSGLGWQGIAIVYS